MEVHHSHHLSHKKKWKEYLLEFLMLFFAVYLGFLAENFREHSIERHREKEYVGLLINDLKSDTTKLGINAATFDKKLLMQDSLLNSFSKLEAGFNKTFYNNLSGITSYPDFIYTDATIQQLKNAGSFRLIKNTAVIKQIMDYDALVKSALINEASLGRVFEKLEDRSNQILNWQKFNQQIAEGTTVAQLESQKFKFLNNTNPDVVSNYYNQMRTFNIVSKLVKSHMKEVKVSASNLIKLIEKEYKVEEKR